MMFPRKSRICGSTRKKLSLWQKKREPLLEEPEVDTATLIEAEGGVESIIHTLLVEGAQLVLLAQSMVARLREERAVTSVARSSI